MKNKNIFFVAAESIKIFRSDFHELHDRDSLKSRKNCEWETFFANRVHSVFNIANFKRLFMADCDIFARSQLPAHRWGDESFVSEKSKLSRSRDGPRCCSVIFVTNSQACNDGSWPIVCLPLLGDTRRRYINCKILSFFHVEQTSNVI